MASSTRRWSLRRIVPLPLVSAPAARRPQSLRANMNSLPPASQEHFPSMSLPERALISWTIEISSSEPIPELLTSSQGTLLPTWRQHEWSTSSLLRRTHSGTGSRRVGRARTPDLSYHWRHMWGSAFSPSNPSSTQSASYSARGTPRHSRSSRSSESGTSRRNVASRR